MTSATRTVIRAARPADPTEVDRLYDICLRTGNNGQDATRLYRDPRLLGEVYVGAYLAFEPSLAFVLDDDVAGPVGYVLGARDTAAFEARCERSWWPGLRRRYPLGVFPAGTRDARLVALIHQPWLTEPGILTNYPAHLHIDLLPGAQGGGHGRRLMERLLAALREQGARGVHLGVTWRNPNAAGFYRHLGFITLEDAEWGSLLGLAL